jgi:hypothetical protein
MRPSILIAGAGQLGSRYLQGLAASEEALDIWVFDISAESLRRAEVRWNEVEPRNIHSVTYITDLGSLPPTLHIAIVATTAEVRVDLVEQIASSSHAHNWILEKVLAQNKEDLSRIERILGNGTNAWVNTPRHQWELYRALHRQYPDKPALEASFENFSGLACNTIHFVDFVCRWSDTQLVEVDTSGLYAEWYESKRSGFYEVDGRLKMRFADGSLLSLVSEPGNLAYSTKLKIEGDEWKVEEAKGIASTSDGRIVEGRTGLQSDLTAPVVRAILNGVPCGLPMLTESIQQHEALLGALIAHWNTRMPNKVDRLPIT